MHTFIYALAAILAITIAAAGPSLALAHDDTPPPAPAGVHASDGPNPGTAAVAWDAPQDDASSDDTRAYYRVGWVSADDIAAAQNAGQDWLDAFAFVDVANRGQTAYTVKGLTPGAHYAFIVAAVNRRFGAAAWSEWTYLTPSASPSIVCPTPTPTPAPTPTPTLTPPTLTPTAAPAPTATLVPPTSTPTPAPTPHPTPPASGSGTANYDTDQDGLIEVASLSQLAAIRYDLDGDGIPSDERYAAAFPDNRAGMGCPAAGCAGYELTANLDFDTNDNGIIDTDDTYWNDGAGWHPIARDHLNIFATTFEGNGHTIANLHINRPHTDNIGLFGVANPDSHIRNVDLVSVAISGNYYVGSLIGVNYGKVTASGAAGSVFGSNANIGGLIGRNSGAITNSHATVAVTANGDEIGGLVGNNGGAITASYATGDVDGSSHINGGLVGENSGTIASSYSTGSVSTRRSETGGLVGRNDGAIMTSYSTGNVLGNGGNIGGLVGRNTRYRYRAISDSYWDTQTSGQAHSAAGGIGLTTAQLQSPTDNTGIYANWNPEYWHFGTASQYPVLHYANLDPAAQRP